MPPIEQAQRYAPAIVDISQALDLDYKLIMAVTWTESHFKPRINHLTGANGLMQVLPRTKAYVLKSMGSQYNTIYTANLKHNLKHNELSNLIIGSYYMKYLLNKFKSKNHAIIAYNMGPTRVRSLLAQKLPVGHDHDYLKKVNRRLASLK